MSIKIEMLRCFALVAQTGNLADTAARLGRTQSAVSMTLKQLEDDLGQKLFVGERKNKLTPLGEQIFTLAQQQVQNFDAAVREMKISASSPTGLLRIVSIPSAVGMLIPRAIAKMTVAHPGLKFDVRDTDTETAIDALVRGQADLGITSGTPVINGMQAHPLFTDQFGLTCAADHPFAKQDTPIPLSDLGTDGFISNNLCHQIDHAVVQDALAQTLIHAHNTLSLIGMLRAGQWWTILPQTVVRDLPGGLVFRKIEGMDMTRQVSALVSEKSGHAGFASACVDQLKMLIQQGDHVDLSL